MEHMGNFKMRPGKLETGNGDLILDLAWDSCSCSCGRSNETACLSGRSGLPSAASHAAASRGSKRAPQPQGTQGSRLATLH